MSSVPLLRIDSPGDARRPLVIRWGASSYFGWGIYGLNLMLALARDPKYALFCAERFLSQDIVLDSLRHMVISAYAQRYAGLWDALDHLDGNAAAFEAPVLVPLASEFLVSSDPKIKQLSGRPTVGVVFMHEAILTPDARTRANQLPLIIAGCSWNERALRSQGVTSVATVLQGVDTSQFHPAPRAGVLPGRFIIFSGGKLEFRKGQDLVLAAFRAFRQRHPEAVLVTAWHSPWYAGAAGISGLPDIVNPDMGSNGVPDVRAWAAANGIPPESIVALGMTPNIAMPHVLREADVGLFPNRAEGGTNLVAMECMACGVPTILSANTGHLDLLHPDGVAIPLRRQRQPMRAGYDTTDWGESDVEEMVEALEQVWRDRDSAAAMGRRAAAFMAGLNWPIQAQSLLRAIEPVLP